MASAKTAAFTDAQRDLARIARGLAHPARVAIVELLAAKRTCISGDIAAELPLSRTTVSQHLQELKALGLIRGEIDGLTVCYCLDEEVLAKAFEHFRTFFQHATCCAPQNYAPRTPHPSTQAPKHPSTQAPKHPAPKHLLP